MKADAPHDAGDRRIASVAFGDSVDRAHPPLPAVDAVPKRSRKRENAETRGKRYLVEGRLTVREVSSTRILATCRGTGSTWSLGFMNGVWFCECPARSRCSHLWSLLLVMSR